MAPSSDAGTPRKILAPEEGVPAMLVIQSLKLVPVSVEHPSLL